MGMIMRNGKPLSGSSNNADNIEYNNSNSGMPAETGQEAMDWLANEIRKFKVVETVLDRPSLATGQYVKCPCNWIPYRFLSISASFYRNHLETVMLPTNVLVQLNTSGNRLILNTNIELYFADGAIYVKSGYSDTTNYSVIVYGLMAVD